MTLGDGDGVGLLYKKNPVGKNKNTNGIFQSLHWINGWLLM
jgi:hypothetical protein